MCGFGALLPTLSGTIGAHVFASGSPLGRQARQPPLFLLFGYFGAESQRHQHGVAIPYQPRHALPVINAALFSIAAISAPRVFFQQRFFCSRRCCQLAKAMPDSCFEVSRARSRNNEIPWRYAIPAASWPRPSLAAEQYRAIVLCRRLVQKFEEPELLATQQRAGNHRRRGCKFRLRQSGGRNSSPLLNLSVTGEGERVSRCCRGIG